MKKNSILLAVKDKLVREAWSDILNSDNRFSVVATTGDSEEVPLLCNEHSPAVIVTDIEESQVALLSSLKDQAKEAEVKAVFILTTALPSFAMRMMQNAAIGLLTKNNSLEEMIYAISEVAEKRKYIGTEIKRVSYFAPL